MICLSGTRLRKDGRSLMGHLLCLLERAAEISGCNVRFRSEPVYSLIIHHCLQSYSVLEDDLLRPCNFIYYYDATTVNV